MVQLASPSKILSGPIRRVTAKTPDYWTHLAWITAGATPLCAWRHAANLPTVSLAAELGISPDRLVRIERRQETLEADIRRRASEVLGVPEADLKE